MTNQNNEFGKSPVKLSSPTQIWIDDVNQNNDISLCKDGCYCMTHTIDGKCGKCGAVKPTNQNNELDELDEIVRRIHFSQASFNELTKEELYEDIGDDCLRVINKGKKAIQALYAPKPVENGELRETILSILGIVDRTSGNRPEQIATLEQEITAHTNAEIARTLDSLEAEFDRHAKSIGLWGMEGLMLDTLARTGNLSSEQKVERDAMVTERRALAVLHGAIAAERAKLKEVK